MKQSEKRMKEILSQDIQVSGIVEERIRDTYQILREKKRASSRKKTGAAAAAIAALCLVLTGAVYASVRTEFFQAMFGNITKESNEAIQKEIDDGKGGKVLVTIPSKEYVPVDEEKAEAAVGEWVMEEPIEKKIGSHTLRIENFAYDRNGALMYFTLEREGGVTALSGDQETNLTKGASFTDESDFYFICETDNNVVGYDCIYIDTVKSVPNKIYAYSYILWSEALENDDVPYLRLDTYPCTRKELNENTEITTEKIPLTDKGQIPVKIIDMGEEGYLEYSPISLSVDMSKGLGLSAEEAGDPWYLKYLEIAYGDGSYYIVCDKENNKENSGYAMESGTFYRTIFNRLADTEAIEEIIVNDVRFPAE